MKSILLRATVVTCTAAAVATCVVSPSAAAEGRSALPAEDDADGNQVDEFLDKGLGFLTAQQKDDGSLGEQYPVAITSLAGLAMLGAGGTPDKGPRNAEIAAAMEFVLARQRDDGNLSDRNLYEHAFATVFLAECLRRGGANMRLAERLQPAVRKAVKLIVDSQHVAGGWRYRPLQPGDVTSTSCQVLALAAARAAGVKVPQETLDRAADFLIGCQSDDGGFRYKPGIGATGIARTAACANSLLAAGKHESEELRDALSYLRRPPPEFSSPQFLFYALFMAKTMSHDDGEARAAWRTKLAGKLLPAQRADGSWPDPLGSEYATAMACLVLQSKAGDANKR